ncbi:hypothetical protein CIB48_g11868 [Xylaria polymorpha]|nr:hypothetical protein CIB48_g11868 [Xylaria polymorpha]
MPNIQSFNAQRARSYLFRLPLFTRAMLVIMIVFGLVGLQAAWDIRQWGALIPDELGITTMYRVNTFPLIHQNLLHAVFNILALAPLLERFETEFGTLTSLALFFGLYVLVERFVLKGNVAVMGASYWDTSCPTWTTPLFMVLVVEALIPGTSFLGHLCGVGTGYLFGLGYLKFLAPPEWILREIEGRLNLLGRLPHYVSVDQKTYGRFGVLPTNASSSNTTPMSIIGSTQRLGP